MAMGESNEGADIGGESVTPRSVEGCWHSPQMLQDPPAGEVLEDRLTMEPCMRRFEPESRALLEQAHSFA